jgi:hypothetical protein
LVIDRSSADWTNTAGGGPACCAHAGRPANADNAKKAKENHPRVIAPPASELM